MPPKKRTVGDVVALAAYWDESGNKGIDPSSVPVRSVESVFLWSCPREDHAPFTASPRRVHNSILRKREPCPMCQMGRAKPKASIHFRSLAAHHPGIVAAWDNAGNEKINPGGPATVGIASAKAIVLRCAACAATWTTRPDNVCRVYPPGGDALVCCVPCRRSQRRERTAARRQRESEEGHDGAPASGRRGKRKSLGAAPGNATGGATVGGAGGAGCGMPRGRPSSPTHGAPVADAADPLFDMRDPLLLDAASGGGLVFMHYSSGLADEGFELASEALPEPKRRERDIPLHWDTAEVAAAAGTASATATGGIGLAAQSSDARVTVPRDHDDVGFFAPHGDGCDSCGARAGAAGGGESPLARAGAGASHAPEAGQAMAGGSAEARKAGAQSACDGHGAEPELPEDLLKFTEAFEDAISRGALQPMYYSEDFMKLGLGRASVDAPIPQPRPLLDCTVTARISPTTPGRRQGESAARDGTPSRAQRGAEELGAPAAIVEKCTPRSRETRSRVRVGEDGRGLEDAMAGDGDSYGGGAALPLGIPQWSGPVAASPRDDTATAGGREGYDTTHRDSDVLGDVDLFHDEFEFGGVMPMYFSDALAGSGWSKMSDAAPAPEPRPSLDPEFFMRDINSNKD